LALFPAAKATLKAPTEVAVELVPTATAPSNSPLADAVAPLPTPTATLVGVLVQPVPALMPLIDAHVASADPAPPSAAAANPDATAPSRTPPASRSFDLALCVPMSVCLPVDGVVDG
jgi:hypothetical protein